MFHLLFPKTQGVTFKHDRHRTSNGTESKHKNILAQDTLHDTSPKCTSKQHQSTNGGDIWRHHVCVCVCVCVCDTLAQKKSLRNTKAASMRHPRTTTSLKLFAIRHPYGSSEVELKCFALKALDPFRVLLRCHPFF